MKEFTEAKIEDWKKKISKMDHEEMARLIRFVPAGHIVFRNNLPLIHIFNKRFKELGGMTTAISKKIGWGDLDGRTD